MSKILFSFRIRQAATRALGNRGNSLKRLPQARQFLGIIFVTLAILLAWQSHWFHAEKDLSRYPQIQLSYTGCRFEEKTHSKSSTTRQIVFSTVHGRYIMEDGVWKGHFDGPSLAARLSAGGTVHVWLHPKFDHVLRGIKGGAVEIPPEWGLEYDQRNMTVGRWVCAVMVLAGMALAWWKR